MRRAVFYLFYDPQGQVDDYVLHTLGHLRPHAEQIFVVSNTPLDAADTAPARDRRRPVWERENVGFDVWAYKEAMEQFGAERLADYDEVILLNSTFFGPRRQLRRPSFAEMDARDDIDFWGITEHGPMRPAPVRRHRPLARHIQSHWIAVRRRMVTSTDWAEYWDEMPMIDDLPRTRSSGTRARFTPYFVERGYPAPRRFPADELRLAPPDHGQRRADGARRLPDREAAQLLPRPALQRVATPTTAASSPG